MKVEMSAILKIDCISVEWSVAGCSELTKIRISESDVQSLYLYVYIYMYSYIYMYYRYVHMM